MLVLDGLVLILDGFESIVSFLSLFLLLIELVPSILVSLQKREMDFMPKERLLCGDP